MVLGRSIAIFKDLETLFKVAQKNSYGLKTKDINEILKEIREANMKLECSELEFIDFRFIDDSFKRTISDVVSYLIKKKVIKQKESIIRVLEGYFVFDEKVFAGLRIQKPQKFFDEKDILQPLGKNRRKQTLVKYPPKIANYIREGAQFSFLRTIAPDKDFVPTGEERKYFDDFIYLENKTNQRKSYFGVWK